MLSKETGTQIPSINHLNYILRNRSFEQFLMKKKLYLLID